MDTDGILRLIDAVLPFEVCLYHQVVPLTVKDAKLHLGMVDREDENALKYLQNLFQHTGYTVVPNRISTEAHQFVMSAYLTYSNQRSPAEQEAAARSSLNWLQAVTPSLNHPSLDHPSLDHANLDHSSLDYSSLDHALSDTLTQTLTTADVLDVVPDVVVPDVVVSDVVVSDVVVSDVVVSDVVVSDVVVSDVAVPKIAADGVALNGTKSVDGAAESGTSADLPDRGVAVALHPGTICQPSERSAEKRPPRPSTLVSVPPLPEIHPEPPDLPISMLLMLPPQRLLPALLAKALSCGIGRLFFERRQHEGRILYSQDGQPQAALEALPLDFYQATLDRLKQFMTMTPEAALGGMVGAIVPEANPKPILEQREELEGEFLYRSEQVLLRLTLIPGNYGEEATLQVLRGKAMQFYQERKLEEWGRDALSAATNLHRLLHKIQSTLSRERTGLGSHFSCLSQLEATLMQLEAQIHDLSQTENVTNTNSLHEN